jgi:hypothetical protein
VVAAAATQILEKLAEAAAALVTQAAEEAAPEDKAITAELPCHPLVVAVVVRVIQAETVLQV